MAQMRFRTAPAIAVASLLAACASQPQSNAALDAAHQRLAQLEQDPSARQYASAALGEAEQSLGAAQNAYSRGETTAFNHDLFMADRALATAEAQAQNEAARQHLAQLGQNRDQILLQARNAQLQQQGAALQQQGAALQQQNSELQQRTAQLQATQQELRAYQTRETNQGTVVTLYNLPFETGKAVLQPGAAIRLQPLANYLKEHPGRQVIVEGNTDSTGSPEANQQLSQQRADAVRDFLVSAGVTPDRVIARGLGSAYPVASNANAAGRLQNRRVDVVIEAPQSTAALPEGMPTPTTPSDSGAH